MALLLGPDVRVVEIAQRIEGVAYELRLDLFRQPLRQGGKRQTVAGRRIAGSRKRRSRRSGQGELSHPRSSTTG
jgi:hypothetical protein